MTMYYVATLAHYALVEADSESAAREKGRRFLRKLEDNRRVPIEIKTVRPATPSEIELCRPTEGGAS